MIKSFPLTSDNELVPMTMQRQSVAKLRADITIVDIIHTFIVSYKVDY